MTTYEPDAYYATYRERAVQQDGSEAFYSYFVDPSVTWMLEDFIHSKADLIAAVTKQLGYIAPGTFTMTETENGFKFERYILWNADETDFTNVEPGAHSHHETFTVGIKQYIQATDPIKRLEERDEFVADMKKRHALSN